MCAYSSVTIPRNYHYTMCAHVHPTTRFLRCRRVPYQLFPLLKKRETMSAVGVALLGVGSLSPANVLTRSIDKPWCPAISVNLAVSVRFPICSRKWKSAIMLELPGLSLSSRQVLLSFISSRSQLASHLNVDMPIESIFILTHFPLKW